MLDAGPDTSIKPGARVYVRGLAHDPAPYSMSWGNQVSHALCTESASIPVPEAVSNERAIYAKVSGIALHGGVRGAKVVAIDVDADRLALAKKAGAVEALDARTDGVVDRVHEITGGGAASGTPIPRPVRDSCCRVPSRSPCVSTTWRSSGARST